MTSDQSKVESVLVSACLLGNRVRYDGNSLTVSHNILTTWIEEGRVISVCPEVDAGMSIPREPAEIAAGDGQNVLAGNALVVTRNTSDVSDDFKRGAQIALSLCLKNNIQIAVLTESSPSCGSSKINDGNFSGTKIPGMGVTTALLRNNGIQVFSQFELVAANKALQQLE